MLAQFGALARAKQASEARQQVDMKHLSRKIAEKKRVGEDIHSRRARVVMEKRSELSSKSMDVEMQEAWEEKSPMKIVSPSVSPPLPSSSTHSTFTNIDSCVFDLSRMADSLEEIWQEDEARKMVRNSGDGLGDEEIESSASSIRCQGDIIYDKVVWDLNHIPDLPDGTPFRLSANQMKFCMAFLHASLPQLYGKDFDRFHDRIMAEHNLTRIASEVFVQSPRRFGKTVAVATFIACFLRHVPGKKVAVFSTGKRVSELMMKEIKKAFMIYEKNDTSRIVKSTHEQLAICRKGMSKGKGAQSKEGKMAADHSDTSWLRCLPASPTGGWVCVCACYLCCPSQKLQSDLPLIRPPE